MEEGEKRDGALARRAAAGDREAFAALLERHYDRIFRVGARVLGDADEAADLAQDVCVALPARLASWRGESRFTTWLYRVVVNAARDALRRKDARRRGERSFAETEALLRIDDASPACESGWLRRALGHRKPGRLQLVAQDFPRVTGVPHCHDLSPQGRSARTSATARSASSCASAPVRCLLRSQTDSSVSQKSAWRTARSVFPVTTRLRREVAVRGGFASGGIRAYAVLPMLSVRPPVPEPRSIT